MMIHNPLLDRIETVGFWDVFPDGHAAFKQMDKGEGPKLRFRKGDEGVLRWASVQPVSVFIACLRQLALSQFIEVDS